MTKTYDIAVVGASNSVGEAIISLLEERAFPLGTLYPLDSEATVGDTVLFKGRPLLVTNLTEFDFSLVQIALFSTRDEIAARYLSKAAEAGCIVIDGTASSSLDEAVPMVVPEVNPERVADYKASKIISLPSPASSALLLALKPVYDAVGIERINVVSLQSVSGSGQQAVEELAQQTARLLNGQKVEKNIFPHQIAFNVFPQVGQFCENGATEQEMLLSSEIHKVFENDCIKVNATCVQLPVFYGHSMAIHIETRERLEVNDVRKLIRKTAGIKLIDKPESAKYPTPVDNGVGSDEVLVGRIREDISHPFGLNLWIVSDNVRKSSALNSVQIAELLIKDYI